MSVKHEQRSVENKANGQKGITRRQVIQSTAFVGGCAILAAQATKIFGVLTETKAADTQGPYELAQPHNQLYSTCLQCHVSCQIKAKIWDGTLAKLAGSPYSPQNFLPHIPYKTRPQDAATIDGKLCAKGQSGIQTYYDPYRIRKVLKRAGERGSNKWRTVPFNQFIEEVVRGGKLFAEVGDSRLYPGFDEVVVLRDAELSKKMAEDAQKCGKGEISIVDLDR